MRVSTERAPTRTYVYLVPYWKQICPLSCPRASLFFLSIVSLRRQARELGRPVNFPAPGEVGCIKGSRGGKEEALHAALRERSAAAAAAAAAGADEPVLDEGAARAKRARTAGSSTDTGDAANAMVTAV